MNMTTILNNAANITKMIELTAPWIIALIATR